MATINISLKNILGVDISTSVTIKLLDDILIDGLNIVAGTKQSVPTNSAGDATVTLYPGNYLVYILDRQPLRIAVPTGTGAYNMADLIDDDSTPVVSPSLIYERVENKGLANGYASLGGDGKVPSTQLPPANQPPVTSVNTKTGDVTLVKSDIGLEDVDNTSDVNKPLSVADQVVIEKARVQRETDLSRIPDNRIRFTALFGGYEINSTNSPGAVESIDLMSTDLQYPLDGPLRFMLVGAGNNPTTNDLNNLTAFMNHPVYGRLIIVNYETLGSSAQINAGSFDGGLTTLVEHFMAKKALDPTWDNEVIIKLNHETNLTASYQWAAVNSVNLAAAGGDLQVAINNWAIGFRRLSNLVRRKSCVDQFGNRILEANVPLDSDGVPVYSDTCRPFIQIVHELSVTNGSGGETELVRWTPGKKYFNYLFWNPYNRAFTISGDGEWREFEQFTRLAFEQATPLMNPGRPWGIGELSSTGGGRVTDTFSSSFTIISGGTGFPASQTAALIPDSAITATGVKPTIRYDSNSSGTITAMYANFPGQENTTVTIASSWSGGTGLNVTVRVRTPQHSKAQWLANAIDWCVRCPNLKYINIFAENKGTVTNTNWTDYRDWAPNTASERRALGIALRSMNSRYPVQDRNEFSNPNLCTDPLTQNLASWTVRGSNPGTIALNTSAAHEFPYNNAITSVLEFTHNGTAGSFLDNVVTIDIPSNTLRTGQKVTFSFWAKAEFDNETGRTGHVLASDPLNPLWPELRAGIRNVSADTYSPRVPPFLLERYWKKYIGYTSPVTSGASRIEFQLGANSIPMRGFITGIKYEVGDVATPLDTSGTLSANNNNTFSGIQSFPTSSTQASMRLSEGFAPTTPQIGMKWLDNVTKGVHTWLGGLVHKESYVVRKNDITGATVQNTTTPTDFVTVSLPAGFWAANKKLELSLFLRYGTDVVAPTLDLAFYHGTNLLQSIGAKTLSASLSGANQGLIKVTYSINANTIATSGSNLSVAGLVTICNPVAGTSQDFQFLDIGSKTSNTQDAQVLALRATWGTASANNVITSRIENINII